MFFSIIKLHEQSAARLAWVGGEAKDEKSKGEQAGERNIVEEGEGEFHPVDKTRGHV